MEKMELVILDGYTINPGDIGWDPLEGLGHLVCYDRTAPDDIVEKIGEASAIFVSDCTISRPILEQCPKLKFVGALSTGYNNIDIEFAKKRGIAVCNVPAYAADPVSQHTFALILEISNNVGDYNMQVKTGRWSQSPDFMFVDKPVCLLAGKSIGIIGYGAIGKRVGDLAESFGMKLNIYDAFVDEYKSNWEAVIGSDFVTLHCPANADNIGMVDKLFLSQMKDGAVLINAARGILVNENDLAYALSSGKLAAAGLDVLSVEPPSEDNCLIKQPNCYITPHIAWAARESRMLVVETAARSLDSFLKGGSLNRIV